MPKNPKAIPKSVPPINNADNRNKGLRPTFLTSQKDAKALIGILVELTIRLTYSASEGTSLSMTELASRKVVLIPQPLE